MLPVRHAPHPSTARRWFAVAAGVMLLLGQLVAPATADHGGREIGSLLACDRPVEPPRCTSVANNFRHFVAFDESLTDGLATALRDSMAEDYGPTRLNMYVVPTASAWTDVIAFSADYGDNGAAGWVYCPRDAPQGLNILGDRWCQQQELHFNLNPRFAAFFADASRMAHIACHELGHTVGLRHWGNPPHSAGPEAATCMNANTPAGPTGLAQIDLDHIDAYPYAPPRPVPTSRGFRIAGDPGEGGSTAAGWDAAIAAADEVEHYASVAEMAAAADAVVRGRIRTVEAGRSFGAPSGPAFHYAAATLVIEEVVAGSLHGDGATVTLEVPLFGGPDSLDRVADRLPRGESIFFLRSKAASARAAGLPLAEQLVEAPYYRLVVLDAVIVSDRGVAVVPDGETRALRELAGQPFDEVVALLR